MNWTEQHTRETEAMFVKLPPARQHQVDAIATQLFCQMKMLGLASDALPGSLPLLSPNEVARLRTFAIVIDATTSVFRPQGPVTVDLRGQDRV